MDDTMMLIKLMETHLDTGAAAQSSSHGASCATRVVLIAVELRKRPVERRCVQILRS